MVEPDQKYELIVCNFGFDLDNFEESTTPHGTAECEGQVYCPGCSDDMKSQLDNYLSAWRSWGSDYSSIAIVGRISNFGILRALVLAAEGVGWNVNLSLSKMLEVEGITKEMESFPALLFQPSLISPGSVPLEKIADYFGAH